MQIINLHTSFLPFNKGSATNVFSITLNHPVGVSLHYINNLIDAGDIISQEKLKVSSIDTGKSLYIKLQNKALELLNNTIPKILDNNITSTAPTEKGNLNLVSDLHKIDLINLEETYKAKDLINLLRARTFDDYGSAYFIDDDGKKVFLRLRLNYE